MSNVKRDLMKEIEAKVARKKVVAKQVSRQKTVANWVAEFFTEYEKTKNLDAGSIYHSFAALALDRLSIQVRGIDRKCFVDFRRHDDGNPTVEIRWSKPFIQANSCEEVLVFDASSAYFQSALEDV
jgi:hypothetical protein